MSRMSRPKKRAGRGVQCEQCEALKRRFGVVPRRYRPRFGGTFAAKFCGAFCGKPLKTKTGQDEKHALTCSNAVVPPAGFEPAISTLKGWRPWPLDDGDSGKEYSRLFCRRVYRWQTGKPPQRCLSLCGGEVLGEQLHGCVVGGVLVGVVEGLERQQGCGLRIAAALEGVGDEPVGEFRVLG